MKTVKFRIWNGMEMVYDITVGKFGVFYVNPEKGDGLNPQDTCSLTVNTTKYPKGTPLMWYLDIDDKNGKEIYVGDTLKVKGDICYIKYTDEMKIPIVFFINKTAGNWKHINEISSKFTEIIGNIYKNPELTHGYV